MFRKLSLADLDVRGKKVLIRVDFNVPLDKQGKITDDSRIVASLPSIRYVIERGGSVILMSHLGRPKGRFEAEFSLAPCAKKLSDLLGKKVTIAPDCVGPEVEELVQSLQPGQVLLLENLRFHEAEENPKKDPTFAKALASLGDLYVNDAFGTAHRAHSSTVDIAKYFPGKAASGFLLEKEIQFLGSIVGNPKRPFYALIGGAKISTKIGVLKALLKQVDKLLIGGGMAYTFFKAQGIAIGNSIHEDEFLQQAREILAFSREQKIPLLLPEDVVITDRIAEDAKAQAVDVKQGIPDGWEGVDIGPKTVQKYSEGIQDAATVFWNGPMGIFEVKQFAKGTNAIAKAISELSATTIVGGGESIAAVEAAGVANKMTHLSTGGGAALEYLEYGTLPGLEALSDVTEMKSYA